ncbi:TIGR02186 family protein [Tropicimonas sp. TH_r6]|uniref:TIGR02186 family protein n=1 Tax=Tropicimonas sp. TH_r6 TaxID=3082085 RepID=UPI00295460C5|nr:TIGR02186 family protein [Tropicimonas sp. TH_r6]MDV7141876.1 TIGR02186 family protein [Tropicimonas sp. TH_r6]
MRLIALLLSFWTLVLPAAAQEIVADLSQSRVAITASFSGSEILVFGAVRHVQGAADFDPANPEIDVIITVSGPLEAVTVRKKARKAGIWINAEALEVDAAPALYKVASSLALSDILSESEDRRHHISIPHAIREIGGVNEVGDAEAFTEALIRIRTEDGLYEEMPYEVQLQKQTLFRTDFKLPSNLVEGIYTVRIFLTRDKQVVSQYTRVLNVRKVGIERWIYNLAQDHALIYGILSLAIAIAAGWGASAAFRYARGS